MWPFRKKEPRRTYNHTLPDFYPVEMAESLGELFGGKETTFLKDFLEVPEVNAVLNIRARAMASGIIDAFSKTTGKPQSNNQSLVRILRNPNWYQGSKEFWKQSSLFRDIFGEEFIYFLTPEGMPKNFKGMFTLNPASVLIEYDTDGVYFLDPNGESLQYFYSWDGKKRQLEKENILHLNDNNVQTSQQKMLGGLSRLQSLQPAIKNIREAYKKRLVASYMPIGVLSNGAGADGIGTVAPMQEEQKDELQRKLRVRGALPIISGLPVNYSNMEISPVRLGLFEETREDTAKICDAFGVPYEVLASQKGSTYANLKEAKKQMYEETIIPDATEKVNSINNHLGTESMAWEVQAHFDHLAVFDEDKKQRAASLRLLSQSLIEMVNAGLITTEQAQAELLKYKIG